MVNEAGWRLLGLARRAGYVLAGHEAVRKGLGSVRLIVLAADAGASTRRDVLAMAASAGVPVLIAGPRDELGRRLGQKPRAVVAVTDTELARGIRSAWEERIAGVDDIDESHKGL